MNELDLYTKFTNNGFFIKDTMKFSKETDNIDLDKLIDELVELKKKANESVDILDFSRSFTEKFSSIEEIVNSDDYFRFSDVNKKANMENKIKEIIANFTDFTNFIKAENNMKLHKRNMLDVSRKIWELSKNQNLSDLDRTKETLRLKKEEVLCEQAYNEALDFYRAEEKQYRNSLKGFDLNGFKNKLLKEINELVLEIPEIALTPENKNKVQEKISEIRNDVAYYGLDSLRSESEFKNKCVKYGIEYDSEKLLSNSYSPKVEIKKEEKKEVVDDFFATPTIVPVSEVNLDVKPEENQSDVSNEKESNETFIEDAPETLDDFFNKGYEELIPPEEPKLNNNDEKIKVKKTRRALISAFPKALLFNNGIASLIKKSPEKIAKVASESKFVSAVNNLKNKIVSGINSLSNYHELEDTPENVINVSNKSEDLMETYKDIKMQQTPNMNSVPELNNEPVDSLDQLERDIEREIGGLRK